jgi:hypothetical protein
MFEGEGKSITLDKAISFSLRIKDIGGGGWGILPLRIIQKFPQKRAF